MNHYTGRNIAIFTDSHGLLEPTLAVLIDIKKRGIDEIYSLGDNIGVGPNPSEVIDLLTAYNVKSVAGNSEEYINLGTEPFSTFHNLLKKQSHLWTLSKLNEEQKGIINLYPKSFELFFGGQNIALAHFGNDIRFDYQNRSTWFYQKNLESGKPAYKQFLYTNSDAQKNKMTSDINLYGENNPLVQGIKSAIDKPLFSGKTIDKFDALIQGHVHWKLYEESDTTKFYSIRSVGMAYGKDAPNLASYVILKEKIVGYDFEEILIEYDREKMIDSILKSDSPDKTIEKFTNLK